MIKTILLTIGLALLIATILGVRSILWIGYDPVMWLGTWFCGMGAYQIFSNENILQRTKKEVGMA